MKSTNLKPIACLKDILSFLMLDCDIDDTSLSRETGIPVSTISRMRLNSEANPTITTLRPLAKYFAVSIDQLLGDLPLDKNRIPGNHNPSTYTFTRLPLISWDFVIDWILKNPSQLDGKFLEWLSTEKEVGSRCFALPILTNSFGLAFRKDSIVMIDPDQQPVDNDLILLKNRENNFISLKQLLIDGDEMYIKSLNQELKKTTLLTKKEEIIGVVFETRLSFVEKRKFQKEATKNGIFHSFIHPFPKTT